MASYMTEREAFRSLYAEYSQDLFRLFFLHTCRVNASKELLQLFYEKLSSSGRGYSVVNANRLSVFSLAAKECSRWYEKKLRRKEKPTVLAARQLPFSMNDGLTALLSLHYSLKTPVFLCCYLGLSEKQAAGITSKSEKSVHASLSKAEAALSMSAEEIKKELSVVVSEDGELESLFGGVLLKMDERGHRAKQFMRRFCDSFSTVAPLLAAVMALILLISFLAVHFNWF